MSNQIVRLNLTAELVRELFDYDPKSGQLFWHDRHGKRSRRAGGEWLSKGRLLDRRYRRVSIEGYAYLEHRIIWLHVYGKLPKWPLRIDHINGNGTDNRLVNLRVATPGQNMINRPFATKMIYFNKDGTWSVNLRLGGFKTKRKAALFAYTTMKQIHGDFVNPEHYGLNKNSKMEHAKWQLPN